MRNVLLCCFTVLLIPGLALLFSWILSQEPPPPTFPAASQVRPASFRVNEPRTGEITWSLDGTWDVMKVEIAGQDNPGPAWRGSWTVSAGLPVDDIKTNLKDRLLIKNLIWPVASLEHTGNISAAHTGTLRVVDDRGVQLLKWQTGNSGGTGIRWFKVLDQSFGYLDLLDPNGQSYLAIRSDGGHPLNANP